MKFGFKSQAELIAVEMRELVGLAKDEPLPARTLAKKLKVPVIDPLEIPGLPAKIAQQLHFEFERNWSGVTIPVDDGSVIIYNPRHLPARQESDIMHELAHILCKHKPARIERTPYLPFACRTFDKEQEDQAAWLGGCLQIPRCALLTALKRHMNNSAIAEHFGASPEMVRFRRNMTGVDKILRLELGKIIAPIFDKELKATHAKVRGANQKVSRLIQPDLFA